MSDTSTLIQAETSEYDELLAIIEDIATPCGARIARHLPPEYRSRRSSVYQTLDVEAPISRRGPIGRFSSDKIVITGWSLMTVPFFISDPANDVRAASPGERRSAIFLATTAATAEVVNRAYLSRGDDRRQPPASIDQLHEVRKELHDLLLRKLR